VILAVLAALKVVVAAVVIMVVGGREREGGVILSRVTLANGHAVKIDRAEIHNSASSNAEGWNGGRMEGNEK
jgi:hypothetical protein